MSLPSLRLPFLDSILFFTVDPDLSFIVLYLSLHLISSLLVCGYFLASLLLGELLKAGTIASQNWTNPGKIYTTGGNPLRNRTPSYKPRSFFLSYSRTYISPDPSILFPYLLVLASLSCLSALLYGFSLWLPTLTLGLSFLYLRLSLLTFIPILMLPRLISLTWE